MSYQAECFYGLLFEADERGWPVETLDAFERLGFEDPNDANFDEWLDMFLGIAPIWEPDISQEEYGRRFAIREFERIEKCSARFGVPWFLWTVIGHHEFPAYGVYVSSEARVWTYRCDRVPEFVPEDVERWRVVLERLREVLPGAEPPGLYYAHYAG